MADVVIFLYAIGSVIGPLEWPFFFSLELLILRSLEVLRLSNFEPLFSLFNLQPALSLSLSSHLPPRLLLLHTLIPSLLTRECVKPVPVGASHPVLPPHHPSLS